MKTNKTNQKPINYEENLANKQKRLQEVLGDYEVLPMIGMELNQNYRMRVHRAYTHAKGEILMSGALLGDDKSGMKIGEAYVDDKKCQEIAATIQGLLKSFKIKTYNAKSRFGLLRYVGIRRGLETNEILVTLVMASIIMPSKNNFVKELRRIHPEISTVIISENYKDGDTFYGDREINLYGKGFISDKMCGREFRINAKSQFTVNPVQTKKICEIIEKWGEFKGTELVLDAYCGVGTYGIVLADKVRKVLSVENGQEMYRDTISNVRKNGIKNVDVYRNQPTEFVTQVVESEKENMEVAIVTQPYYGCGQPFITALAAGKPKQIFLIGRNLKSLGTEVEQLVKTGYKVKRAVGVDVYPWTERIDAVVQLTR
ncbi:MAG: 23S rRNA (uracil(1939)-C(5))-methyltransferase RlmD [Eubacteriales bacterium]